MLKGRHMQNATGASCNDHLCPLVHRTTGNTSMINHELTLWRFLAFLLHIPQSDHSIQRRWKNSAVDSCKHIGHSSRMNLIWEDWHWQVTTVIALYKSIRTSEQNICLPMSFQLSFHALHALHALHLESRTYQVEWITGKGGKACSLPTAWNGVGLGEIGVKSVRMFVAGWENDQFRGVRCI